MALMTMGNEVLGGSNVQFPPGNNKAACRFQAPESFSATKLIRMGGWGAGDKVKAVIYSDNAGNPDQLLGVSDEKIGPDAGTYTTLTFSTPVALTGGTYYWIGCIADVTVGSSNCLNSGNIKYNANTYTDGPSQTFGTASDAGYTYVVWLEGDDGQLRFGRASVDAGGSGTYTADHPHVEKFVLGGSDNVNVSAVATYVTTTSATVKLKFGIFANNAGAPGAKLGQSTEITGTTASTWASAPISCMLAPGTYWLAVIASENVNTPLIMFGGTLHTEYANESEASAFPDPYPESITDNTPVGIDIYASYTISAGTLLRSPGMAGNVDGNFFAPSMTGGCDG